MDFEEWLDRNYFDIIEEYRDYTSDDFSWWLLEKFTHDFGILSEYVDEYKEDFMDFARERFNGVKNG